jgi:hypothetical protein
VFVTRQLPADVAVLAIVRSQLMAWREDEANEDPDTTLKKCRRLEGLLTWNTQLFCGLASDAPGKAALERR